MKEYIILYEYGGKNRYISTIYKNSIGDTTDRDSAIKLKSLEDAKAILIVLNNIEKHDYKIYCLELTFKMVEE